jgi:hypothetical protein
MQIWLSFYSFFTTLQWFPMAKIQIALQSTKDPLWFSPWISPVSFLTLLLFPSPKQSISTALVISSGGRLLHFFASLFMCSFCLVNDYISFDSQSSWPLYCSIMLTLPQRKFITHPLFCSIELDPCPLGIGLSIGHNGQNRYGPCPHRAYRLRAEFTIHQTFPQIIVKWNYDEHSEEQRRL